jgi:HK97 family phage major capsid protein
MLKEQLKNKIAAQAALVNAARDAGRAFTEEEQSQFNALENEIKALENTIEAQKVADSRALAQQTPAEPVIFAQPKNPNEKIWKNGLGEFLQAVANAYKPGGSIDNRLLITPKAAASGMSVGIGADGGFLLDADLIEDLQSGMLSEAQIAPLIQMIPIGANNNSLKTWGVDENSRADGSRWGGVQAYWAAEADTVTKSKPKFRKIEIELEKLMAICYATDELLQDATALRAVIQRAYSEEMAYKMDDAIINGSGVGQPLGILNSPALVTVAKEAGQAADTVVHENVQKMWNRCPARSRARAIWAINQEIEPQLENMTLPIGVGGEVSPYAKEFIERRTMKGRPVVAIEQCKKLGDAGDIVLLDPKQYLGIDKDQVQATESIHVRFLYDENVFRFIYRFNGAPYRNSAITPANANVGYTLSAFVTLAERA